MQQMAPDVFARALHRLWDLGVEHIRARQDLGKRARAPAETHAKGKKVRDSVVMGPSIGLHRKLALHGSMGYPNREVARSYLHFTPIHHHCTCHMVPAPPGVNFVATSPKPAFHLPPSSISIFPSRHPLLPDN
jgi:hypothetical protein